MQDVCCEIWFFGLRSDIFVARSLLFWFKILNILGVRIAYVKDPKVFCHFDSPPPQIKDPIFIVRFVFFSCLGWFLKWVHVGSFEIIMRIHVLVLECCVLFSNECMILICYFIILKKDRIIHGEKYKSMFLQQWRQHSRLLPCLLGLRDHAFHFSFLDLS